MLAVSYLTLTCSIVSVSNPFSYMFCQNENSNLKYDRFYIKVFITFCFVNILIIKFILYWLLKLLNITDNKLFWKTIKSFLKGKCNHISKISLVSNSKVISDDFELEKRLKNFFGYVVDDLEIKEHGNDLDLDITSSNLIEWNTNIFLVLLWLTKTCPLSHSLNLKL